MLRKVGRFKKGENGFFFIDLEDVKLNVSLGFFVFLWY